MTNNNTNQASRVFHPGEILIDELNERQLTQVEFSEVVGLDQRTVNEIIKGKRGVTLETAGAIAAALGTSPDMWLGMQTEYDLFISSKKFASKAQEIRERSELYSIFPITDLVRRGYIKRKINVKDITSQILNALGLTAIDDFKMADMAHLRASEGDIIFGYLKTWIILAKKIAATQTVPIYNKQKLIEYAKTIKDHSLDKSDISSVIAELKKHGIRIVLLPHFSKTRVDGAACWLDKNSPVIVMSLRYERVDNFYFTLLHEIGHIVLHSDSENNDFIDDIYNPSKDPKEKEANDFAIANLGLNHVASDFRYMNITPKIIGQKSEELGINPCLLIGHLQYSNLIPYTSYSKFLNKVKVKQIIPDLIEK